MHLQQYSFRAPMFRAPQLPAHFRLPSEATANESLSFSDPEVKIFLAVALAFTFLGGFGLVRKILFKAKPVVTDERGVLTGYGSRTLSNGGTLTGSFVSGNLEGLGTYNSPDGFKIAGPFIRGKPMEDRWFLRTDSLGETSEIHYRSVVHIIPAS